MQKAPEAVSLGVGGGGLLCVCKNKSLLCVSMTLLFATYLDGCAARLRVVHTCPLTGRGSCRAAAQTAACGGSFGEPSCGYAVAGGDWTAESVLWHHTCTNKPKNKKSTETKTTKDGQHTKRPNEWSKHSKEEANPREIQSCWTLY